MISSDNVYFYSKIYCKDKELHVEDLVDVRQEKNPQGSVLFDYVPVGDKQKKISCIYKLYIKEKCCAKGNLFKNQCWLDHSERMLLILDTKTMKYSIKSIEQKTRYDESKVPYDAFMIQPY